MYMFITSDECVENVCSISSATHAHTQLATSNFETEFMSRWLLVTDTTCTHLQNGHCHAAGIQKCLDTQRRLPVHQYFSLVQFPNNHTLELKTVYLTLYCRTFSHERFVQQSSLGSAILFLLQHFGPKTFIRQYNSGTQAEYSARVPEFFCLMKVFRPKRCTRKRIAEPSEDCWTNRLSEKVQQYNTKWL